MNVKLTTLVILLLAAFVFGGATATAQMDSSAPTATDTQKVVPVNDVEAVEEVSPGEASGSGGGLLAPIGRFHPVVIHFPIAWIMLLVLVEFVALLTGSAGLSRYGKVLAVLTLLSFLPAITTGLILAGAHASDPDFLKLGYLHRNFNISAGIVMLAALAVRLKMSDESTGRKRLPYLLLVVAATGLVVVGSHLGGMMVWGEDFLPLPF
ncbi:MAG: DUF2231 domain-containing protein [Candidatus Glassbacteria bacterium]